MIGTSQISARKCEEDDPQRQHIILRVSEGGGASPEDHYLSLMQAAILRDEINRALALAKKLRAQSTNPKDQDRQV